jgi:putative transposase
MLHKGEYSGKGAPKKYGDRLNFQSIPEEFLCVTEQEKEVTTKIYQIELFHKKFGSSGNCILYLNII